MNIQTFDNYFTCQENIAAFKAAESVAFTPGNICNLLFIFGGTGLGKTHLLKAIKYKVEEKNADIKIVYTTFYDFVNEFIYAIQTNTQSEFKNKYIQLDILLLDDMDAIEGKPVTQQELLHIIDGLIANGKQIVISSCKSPLNILIKRRTLIRRMDSIIIKIENPDYNSRLDFLHKFRSVNDIFCPYDILCFIAEELNTNFSILNSIMKSIFLNPFQSDNTITLNSVKSILKNFTYQ